MHGANFSSLNLAIFIHYKPRIASVTMWYYKNYTAADRTLKMSVDKIFIMECLQCEKDIYLEWNVYQSCLQCDFNHERATISMLHCHISSVGE